MPSGGSTSKTRGFVNNIVLDTPGSLNGQSGIAKVIYESTEIIFREIEINVNGVSVPRSQKSARRGRLPISVERKAKGIKISLIVRQKRQDITYQFLMFKGFNFMLFYANYLFIRKLFVNLQPKPNKD